MITFDPNGGDLGRTTIKQVTPLEFQLIIPHIVEIFKGLAALDLPLPFKYAFEFYSGNKEDALLVIHATKLPPYVKFYEIDGRKLFEMRGAAGGIATSFICYLITSKEP